MKLFFRLYLVTCFCAILCAENVLAKEIVMVDFAIPYSQQLAPNTVIIPFQLEGGLILIDARFSDQQGQFIFDTGANGLVLNKNYVSPDRLIAGTNGIGVLGGAGFVGEKYMRRFDIQELNFEDLTAEVINLMHLEEARKMRILGLVGYEIFKDFEIQINYQEQFLTFSRLDNKGNIIDVLEHTQDKIDSLDFSLAGFLPVIEVQVGNKTKRMGIDSGAEYNLLDIQRSKDILKDYKLLGKTKVNGASRKKTEILGGKLYSLSFNKKFRNPGMFTVLTNFRQIDRLYGEKLDGILGYPFLMRWTTSWNYKKKRMYVHRMKFVKP